MKIIAHCITALVFISCVSAQAILTPSALDHDPASREGKVVVVRGWLDYGFEKRHLFQRADDASGANSGVCISIEVAERLRATATRLNHHYVLVKGTFRSDIARDRVFLGLCNSAGIEVVAINPAS